jgi:putative ATP-dependent endonuclease of the OLD family
VIDAGGIGRIMRLVELAEHFSVRAFVLVDRDGLRAQNDRILLDILGAKGDSPDAAARDAIRAAADTPSPNYAAALANQGRVNALLARYDAYMMASDLEGLLIDAFGVGNITSWLGPEDEGVLDQQFVDDLAGAADARERLGRRLGSKGWDADVKPTGKLEPHLPRILGSPNRLGVTHR